MAFPGDSAWRDKVSVSISCLSLKGESENSFDIYSSWLKFIQEKQAERVRVVTALPELILDGQWQYKYLFFYMWYKWCQRGLNQNKYSEKAVAKISRSYYHNLTN